MKTLTKRKAGGVPKEAESAEKKAKTATKRKAGGIPKEAESAEKKAKREMCMAEAVKDVRALFEQPGIELSDETLKKKLLRLEAKHARARAMRKLKTRVDKVSNDSSALEADLPKLTKKGCPEHMVECQLEWCKAKIAELNKSGEKRKQRDKRTKREKKYTREKREKREREEKDERE